MALQDYLTRRNLGIGAGFLATALTAGVIGYKLNAKEEAPKPEKLTYVRLSDNYEGVLVEPLGWVMSIDANGNLVSVDVSNQKTPFKETKTVLKGRDLKAKATEESFEMVGESIAISKVPKVSGVAPLSSHRLKKTK